MNSLGSSSRLAQVYKVVAGQFMPKDWITARWDEGFYITSVAGAFPPASCPIFLR